MCLNSPGTPRRLFAALRRQSNSTEKSVIASVSRPEQRPFKTPQLPALRAVVSEPAPERRQGFLLLYFQLVGSPSILGGTRSSSRHRLPPHNADRGSKLALAGTDAAPPPFTRHRASHGQTWAVFSSLCLSVHRPSKVGPGFCPELRLAYSRTLCLPCRKAGNLRPDTMQTAYLSSSRKGTKMVLSTRRFSMEGRYG